jgi:hypothetical protein
MSTPKFGDTYFKNTLFKNQEKFDDWISFRFTSMDNPHLPLQEVEAAERQLDPLVFRCEYLAEDVDVITNPWAWAFDKEKHIAKDLSLRVWQGDVNNYLYLSFDFNKNPITCAVIQFIEQTIYVIEQIKLANSDVYELCERILTKYPNFMYIITGDSSGNNLSALVKDNLTYYRIIQQKLRVQTTQMKIPRANPKIEDNQILVNSILSRGKLLIHPEKGKALIWDLLNCSLNADGSVKKGNRDDEAQQWDSLDCLRYYCNTFHKSFITQKNE